MSSPHPAPAPPKRRRKFGCMSMMLTFLALLFLTASVAYYLVRSTPDQWFDIDAKLSHMSDQEMDRRSRSLAQRFITETQGDPNAPITANTNVKDELAKVYEKTIVIPIVDVNIWLAKGLPELMANQNESLPTGISTPRIWVADGELVLSIRAQVEGIATIISGSLAAEMQEDGQLKLKVTSLKSGKLPLPAGTIADQFRDEIKGEQAAILKRIVDVFEGTTFDPVWPHPADEDNREVRLLDFKIEPDQVELKIRNSPRKK